MTHSTTATRQRGAHCEHAAWGGPPQDPPPPDIPIPDPRGCPLAPTAEFRPLRSLLRPARPSRTAARSSAQAPRGPGVRPSLLPGHSCATRLDSHRTPRQGPRPIGNARCPSGRLPTRRGHEGHTPANSPFSRSAQNSPASVPLLTHVLHPKRTPGLLSVPGLRSSRLIANIISVIESAAAPAPSSELLESSIPVSGTVTQLRV